MAQGYSCTLAPPTITDKLRAHVSERIKDVKRCYSWKNNPAVPKDARAIYVLDENIVVQELSEWLRKDVRDVVRRLCLPEVWERVRCVDAIMIVNEGPVARQHIHRDHQEGFGKQIVVALSLAGRSLGTHVGTPLRKTQASAIAYDGYMRHCDPSEKDPRFDKLFLECTTVDNVWRPWNRAKPKRSATSSFPAFPGGYDSPSTLVNPAPPSSIPATTSDASSPVAVAISQLASTARRKRVSTPHPRRHTKSKHAPLPSHTES